MKTLIQKPLKTHTRVCAVIAGLIIASASASAQVAPPAPPPNYTTANTNHADETFLVLPKPGANLFVEAGLQYLHTTHRAFKAGNEGYDYKNNLNFHGMRASFGWRIDARNKIQVDIDALGAYKDRRHGDGYEELTALFNNLLTYSICVPLASDWRWELRFSPSAGYSYTNVSERHDRSHDRDRRGGKDKWENDGDFSFTFGAGAGATFHVNRRIYVDAGYRYLRATGPKIWNVRYEAMNMHALTVSCGVKF